MAIWIVLGVFRLDDFGQFCPYPHQAVLVVNDAQILGQGAVDSMKTKYRRGLQVPGGVQWKAAVETFLSLLDAGHAGDGFLIFLELKNPTLHHVPLERHVRLRTGLPTELRIDLAAKVSTNSCSCEVTQVAHSLAHPRNHNRGQSIGDGIQPHRIQ